MGTRIVLLAWIALSLVACSSLQRSLEKRQATDSYGSIYESPQAIKDKEVSKYEFGYHKLSRPLSETEYVKLQTRITLKRLERNLESSMEKNLYFKNRPFFRSDSERIEFLEIADHADRVLWLDRRNFGARVSGYSQDEQAAIEQNDILLYMSMNAVRESWGEPDNKLISGNEFHGNQKWIYHNYESTPEGYQKKDRTLFFENGRVIAWRTR